MSPSTRPTHHRPWNYSSSCGDRSCRSSSHMSDSSAAVGTSPTVRRSADERREQILGIAIEHFAVGGYRATSMNVIAREAGISQPYLFRLFRTKQELFLACDERAGQTRFAAYRPMGVRTRCVRCIGVHARWRALRRMKMAAPDGPLATTRTGP